MGSAQLDILAFEEHAGQHAAQLADAGPSPPYAHSPSLDLKQQVAERLRSHRQRRGRPIPAVRTPSSSTNLRHSHIASTVAERFAHTLTYRAFLAEEAQRAVDEATREARTAAVEAECAAAEAEIAARNAQALVAVQQELLDELELWNAPQQFTSSTAEVIVPPPAAHTVAQPVAQTAKPKLSARPSAKSRPTPPIKELPTAAFTVRLYQDLGIDRRTLPLPAARPVQTTDPYAFEEAQALDDEIAFRQSPVFEPFTIEPVTPLPANLLEFPRQLVATRKVRPRLAEGPLRDESSPASPQLRIFEVEPEQISTAPETPSAAPEWANIRLNAPTKTDPVLDPGAPALLPSMLPPHTAPLSRRIMAALLDAGLIAAAFAAFAATARRIAGSLPTGLNGAVAAATTLAVFWLLYQMLFFTFSGQTPGMRCARIGLCTLADENPTRAAMRRRILALIIAVCPFGLGILWVLLDDEGLGWHDRISRMYPRAY